LKKQSRKRKYEEEEEEEDTLLPDISTPESARVSDEPSSRRSSTRVVKKKALADGIVNWPAKSFKVPSSSASSAPPDPRV
jgi:hypothetical protein